MIPHSGKDFGTVLCDPTLCEEPTVPSGYYVVRESTCFKGPKDCLSGSCEPWNRASVEYCN